MDEKIEEKLAIEFEIKNDDGTNDNHNNNTQWYFLFGSSDADINPIDLGVVLNTDRKFFVDAVRNGYKDKIANEICDWEDEVGCNIL